MTHEGRPSPEELLKAVSVEEAGKDKGRLKIFLGMAAGVGKTYAMLEEAQVLKRQGAKLVVGVIETHGREETARLLEGLQVLPLQTITYRDKQFQELDIDAILKLHPKLVLIDELAHTNVPGARHIKRWEDVVELLDKGIDVYTTLNVQHIESLNDIIERISEISVHETVPDFIVETATSIQLVDLTPEELLQRLKEGKVYLGDQSAVAAQHFFKKDRLTALREIVLRYTAEKVEHDLSGMVSKVERGQEWKQREKLLVAVSYRPHAQKLIRVTRRLAFSLDAPWFALHVDDGGTHDENEIDLLTKNLALAKDLGAEVITIKDPDIAAGIERIARQKGVTQIIMGRPPKRHILDIFQRFTLLDRLVRSCSDIDIHVIRHEQLLTTYRKKLIAFAPKRQISSYAIIFLWVWALAGLNWLLLSVVSYKIIGVFFLIGILFLSLFFKKGPILFASILYALIWDFFFVPPTGRFVIASNEDTALLILYFFTAIVIGVLVDRAREHKEILIKHEESIQSLYDIVKLIANASSMPDLFQAVTEKLEKLLKGKFEILVKKNDTELALDDPKNLLFNAQERNAAIWSCEHGKEAGWSTTTLPSSQNYFLPLKGYRDVVGVLLFCPFEKWKMTPEDRSFLYAVAQQLANFIERQFSEENQRQLEVMNHEEKVYETVLKSISEELEKPLVSIEQAVGTLEEQQISGKKTLEGEIHRIENSSRHLVRMHDNVAVLARLSGKLIPLNKKLHNIKELVDKCSMKLKNEIGKRKLRIKIPKDLPLVPYDSSLLEILYLNILLNATQHSPAESNIDIDAKQSGNMLVLSISDEGTGIPQEKLNAIFQKFYRIPGSSIPGMGLGLSVSRRIAELHQGALTAENRPAGGAQFKLFLPINTP